MASSFLPPGIWWLLPCLLPCCADRVQKGKLGSPSTKTHTLGRQYDRVPLTNLLAGVN